MPWKRTVAQYGRISAQMARLRELSRLPPGSLGKVAGKVSGWSVGEHLDHVAVADLSIFGGIERLIAEPARDSGGGPSLVGRLVLFTGWIPRGKAKAPAATEPTHRLEEVPEKVDEAATRLEALGERLGDIEAIRRRFEHPLLGSFVPMQWLRFAEVHHHHHLKIVREIARAEA